MAENDVTVLNNEKDMVEKTLEENNDVFSDILNVLIYQGGRSI